MTLQDLIKQLALSLCCQKDTQLIAILFNGIISQEIEASFIVIIMENHVQNCQPSNQFIVKREQKPQLSLNHSTITANCNCHNSYEQLLQFFQNYETKKVDMATLHHSKILKLKKYKDSVYYGEQVQRRREGLGIMIYTSGQIYQGFWQNDLRQGQGYELFANKCCYEGQYQNGKIHGLGKYLWTNGDFYEGEWIDNQKNGTGVWKNQKESHYIGQWKQGEAEGFGIFVQIGASKYEGQFHNFLKQGEGTEHFQSGDIYKGQYLAGKFQGFGEYFWKDGSFYKGMFKNGMRSGHGVWVNGLQKDKYEGQYLNNKKQGYGIYYWSNGDIYKGNYKNNLRGGYGEMYWQDCSFYKGQWGMDKQNGQGQLFDNSNGLVKGIFTDGQLRTNNNQKILRKRGKQAGKQQLDQLHKIQKQRISRQYPTTIKQQPSQIITTSPFNILDRSRPIRYKKPFPIHPLLKGRLNQPNLLRSEHLPYSIRYSQNMRKKSVVKTIPQRKIPHSALHIYKLHRNKLSNFSTYQPSDDYSERDSKPIFKAFKQKQQTSRDRLYSRFN